MSMTTRILKSFIGEKGNLKLPSSILSINITPALNCPADKRNLCDISKECYAKKSEKIYPNTLQFHREQAEIWNQIVLGTKYNVHDLVDTVYDINKKRRKYKVEYFRFNITGDVRHQKDIDTIIRFAELLQSKSIEYAEFPLITVYLYTKRKDLNWEKAMETDNLVVNGSGFMLDNNFDVIEKDIKIDNKYLIGKNKWLCNGDCRLCKACMVKGKKEINIFKH